MFFAVENEFTVNFVRENEEVFFDRKLNDLRKFFSRVNLSCRVVRVADHDRFGVRGYELFDLFNCRDFPVVVDFCRYRNDLYAGSSRKTVVVRVERLRNEYFIAGIKAYRVSHDDSFASAGRYHDVVAGKRNVVSCVVFYKRVLIFGNTLARSVSNDFCLDFIKNFQHFFGSFDIGLADIEVVNRFAFCLRIICVRSKFSDR